MLSRFTLSIPTETREWLLGEDNPAVAVLTRRLLEQADDRASVALWARRNEYAPIGAILDAQLDGGAWTTPGQDYRKYGGSLWQIHFLGELWADGSDERVLRSAEYAFSRQLEDGSWSATNRRPSGSIPCLTANVGRALARLGFARDERVIAALRHCADLVAELGEVNCRQGCGYQLNGYCHMLTPKLLLFLAEVPTDQWPQGSGAMREQCVARLREKSVLRCLPAEAREFNEQLWTAPASQRTGMREQYLRQHPDLHYEEKPGWRRFGYPLSYNSDALEALHALALAGEPSREEYQPALEMVRAAGDHQMRWTLRNSLNGKMLADVETKGAPSKWLTLRALQVLSHFSVLE
jgi:hypothetical protein